MPTSVPALDGLIPIWDFAVTAGISEKELIKSLRDDGVHLLEISVSGRRAAFASRDDLASYITRNARPSDAPPARTISSQLDSQAREIEQLKQKVAGLLAQAQEGAA